MHLVHRVHWVALPGVPDAFGSSSVWGCGGAAGNTGMYTIVDVAGRALLVQVSNHRDKPAVVVSLGRRSRRRVDWSNARLCLVGRGERAVDCDCRRARGAGGRGHQLHGFGKLCPIAANGMLTVDAVQLALNQAAAPCTYSIAPLEASDSAPEAVAFPSPSRPSAGVPGARPAMRRGFAISRGASGTASTTVELTVGANGGSARDGTVSVAGRTFTASRRCICARAPGTCAPGTCAHRLRRPPTPAPPPETVDFEGFIIALSGECPNVNFIAAGRIVVTNGSTEYRKGRCRDLDCRRQGQGLGDEHSSQSCHCRSHRDQR